MKYIGRTIEYEITDGFQTEIRKARIKKIEFHQELGKPIFTCISPFGNIFKLTRDEIYKFL